MKKVEPLVKLAVASIIGTGALLSVQAHSVPAQPTSWEKCAGIAKAGQNDCGALNGAHGCAGQAKTDNLDTEWVYVPANTCTKLTGGVVAAVKPAKK